MPGSYELDPADVKAFLAQHRRAIETMEKAQSARDKRRSVPFRYAFNTAGQIMANGRGQIDYIRTTVDPYTTTVFELRDSQDGTLMYRGYTGYSGNPSTTVAQVVQSITAATATDSTVSLTLGGVLPQNQLFLFVSWRGVAAGSLAVAGWTLVGYTTDESFNAVSVYKNTGSGSVTVAPTQDGAKGTMMSAILAEVKGQGAVTQVGIGSGDPSPAIALGSASDLVMAFTGTNGSPPSGAHVGFSLVSQAEAFASSALYYGNGPQTQLSPGGGLWVAFQVGPPVLPSLNPSTGLVPGGDFVYLPFQNGVVLSLYEGRPIGEYPIIIGGKLK